MGIWTFLNRKALGWLAATPTGIDKDGNMTCEVTFLVDTKDKLSILNVNGLVVFYEKRLVTPIPSKGT